MAAGPQQIFESYIWAGMSHDADAQAELFATDGVFEVPLLPPGSVFPRRLEGREEIRGALKAFHQRSTDPDRMVAVDVGESRYVLHVTSDPDVFIAEIDTAVEVASEAMTMSLVQIYRLRDGKIALLRDYFAPEHVQ